MCKKINQLQENQPTEEEKEISSVDIGNVFTGFDAKNQLTLLRD